MDHFIGKSTIKLKSIIFNKTLIKQSKSNSWKFFIRYAKFCKLNFAEKFLIGCSLYWVFWLGT